jgi:uncharacterized membrane protein YsdA (DUF1294 family)
MFYYSLFIMNLISFGMCYNDKKRAIKHKYRIPESVLLGISIMGGAFGFWWAMYLFHHKTGHLKFLIIEPLCIVLWIVFILLERGII